jgi:hypothetical protein
VLLKYLNVRELDGFLSGKRAGGSYYKSPLQDGIMKGLKNRKIPEGKIEKPEDRIWKKQFDDLSKEDHMEKLHMLGLDDEEAEILAEDFEEVKKGKKGKVLKELEEEVSEIEKK